HSNFMSREAVEQAARLGVVVDIQPAWLYLDTRTLVAQFGIERLRFFQPLRSLFEAGVIAGGGSDHMQKIGSLRSINPYHPFLGMWVAITRRAKGYEGRLHPQEALTREQAIRFYTINNAHLLFLEDRIGSLEEGKQADFVVINRDLLTCPEDEIRQARALATYLDGKCVFERRGRSCAGGGHEHANGSSAFLAGVRGGRRDGGPRRPGLPVPTPAGLGRRGGPGPEGGAAPARDRAPRPPPGGDSARAAPGGGGRPGAEGQGLPRRARGAAPGRGAQRAAPAQCRPQVPRRAGGQLGPPGQPGLARHRPLAADLLGAGLLQERAGAGRPRGELDAGAGGRVGRPARPQGPRGVRRGHGRLGRGGGRRSRGVAGPLGRVQRGLRALLPLRSPRLPL